jgi:WhiB family redox-sensing transcriptional regulator
MRMRGKTVERELEDRVDRARVSCGGEGASIALFFSDQLDAIARAKEICRGCSQQEPCLQGALARREPCGVWGGELFANGVVLSHKRPRGRPRKDLRLPLPA